MTVGEFENMVVGEMEFPPTEQQRALIGALARFCSAGTPSLSVFLLNGYAGTGKTSVMAALVKALAKVRVPTVLLAPTGRAAKVLSRHAGRKAFTIHRKIYRQDGGSLPGAVSVAGVADNPHTGAIFIVDEASMIGSGDSTALLDDLCQYVYGGHECRMILLGDGAQLPPVGCEQSPAMSVECLKAMGLRVSRAVLTETVRQASRSGILYNATALRRAMKADPLPQARLTVSPFADVATVSPEDLEDELSSSYSKYGVDETILITRSNKRAMEFNLAIRRRILEKEEAITRDEPILIAKNNYYWTSRAATGAQSNGDFIANGDIARITRIYATETHGFLRFADVQLTFADRDLTIDAKLILNALTAENSDLNPDTEQQLLRLALRDADEAALASPAAARRVLKASPYYNALRVKYAYAVTCHKAQGGQWESVFVDTGYIAPEALSTMSFYRWLYTASTRATTRLTYIQPSMEVR